MCAIEWIPKLDTRLRALGSKAKQRKKTGDVAGFDADTVDEDEDDDDGGDNESAQPHAMDLPTAMCARHLLGGLAPA
jgi:hypothetical protein